MNDTVRLPGAYLNLVHFGDCRERMREMIAAGVRVNCVVTSPPYYGLRDYKTPSSIWGGQPACAHQWGEDIVDRTRVTPGTGASTLSNAGAFQAATMRFEKCSAFCSSCGAWRGSLGLEPDYRMYVAHLVEVFAVLRELLAEDGVVWLNLGDSYASGKPRLNEDCVAGGQRWANRQSVLRGPGVKPKDLLLIPARVAIALCDDGWYLRSDIIWAKKACMPESVRDRPTKSHEHLFLLAKNERYFYDAEAIAEPVTRGDAGSTFTSGKTAEHQHGRAQSEESRVSRSGNKERKFRGEHGGVEGSRSHQGFGVPWEGSTRNKRDVWFLGPEPFKGAHFATMPTALVEPCILAGTSAHGHCSICGRGWERVVEKGEPDEAHKAACGADSQGEYHGEATKEYAGTGAQDPSAVKARILEGMRERVTTGWRPTCQCDAPVVPGIVFDPFMGSGTTAQVAQSLGRHWIGTELNRDYESLQQERTRQAGMAL